MAFQAQTFHDKPFRITNSLEGYKKVEFKPLNAPQVLFYSCGPTVYGPLHIGNARSLYMPNLMSRWLRHIGYDVNFVLNYTDVDDKIINRSKQEGIPPEDVAQKYVDYCETDMKLMGLSKPTRTVRVTETMDDIVAIVEKLIERKHAYVVNGEVLYSVESFKGYGKLSGKNIEELQAGARVEVGAHKRNPMDFSVWKPHKPGEPHWPSPWSEGRPGWHIECSAMIRKWLGDTIDIHHGGQDLIFPHHENEIAQSEGATGKPFCKYWIHTAFLTISREKMSKSLGNILEIRPFIEKFGAEVLKYLFVKHHYRTPFDFNAESLEEILSELERIYLARKWALEAVQEGLGADSSHSAHAGKAFAGLRGRGEKTFRALEDEMFNDLNSPGALGHLFTLIRDINRAEGESAGKSGLKAPASAERLQVAADFLQLLDQGFKPILNVFGDNPGDMMQQIEKIRRNRNPLAMTLSDEDILKFIEERKQSRLSKNFQRADEIRKELEAQGIILVDSPQGTTWKLK